MPVPDRIIPDLLPGLNPQHLPRLFCTHPSARKGFHTEPRALHDDAFGHAEGAELGSGSWFPAARCWLGPRSPGLWEHFRGWRLAAKLQPASDRISLVCRKILLC